MADTAKGLRTALAKYGGSDDTNEPAGFWFDDPAKLLRRVEALAKQDHKLARSLIETALRLASNDARLRALLAKSIRAPRQDRRGAPTVPRWRLDLVLDGYTILRENGASSKQALALIGRTIQKSPTTIQKYLTLARTHQKSQSR